MLMDSQKAAVSQLNMQMGVGIVASDWNNRIRDAVMSLSSKIPEVGGAVSALIGFLWPQNKVDVFEALKADVIKLIKKEILDFELNLRKSEIDALKITIERYKAAQMNEKSYFLNTWINETDRLSVIFRESTNNIHLILPLITLALLHLTGLRERLDFGKQLYHEDNTKQWKQDLEEMYKTYIVDFLPDVFKKWKAWRADQVEVKGWTEKHAMAIFPFFRMESHATVVDTITGERKHFSVNLTESTTIFSYICQDHKNRMCNDAASDMAGCISTTFVFDKLLPDNNNNLPKYDKGVFDRMFKGPYSEDLLLSEHDSRVDFRSRPDQDDYSPNSGPIAKVIVREWNTIDAMKFVYEKRQGLLAGNERGGRMHEINVTQKPIDGLRMGFSNGVLTYVQILYLDATSSPTFGNRSQWQCQEAIAHGPTSYKVSSWSFRVGHGPSNTFGPSVVQLEYAPQE